jgi:nucleotide-binding universal stress UspA family protein
MGTSPRVGAGVLTVAGVGWFLVYGRSRVDREGAAVDAMRRQVGRTAVDRTRETIDAPRRDYRVLVALDHEVTKDEERPFVRAAAALARPHDGEVDVVRFEQVPDQVSLSYASETESPADLRFETQTGELDAEFDVPVNSGTIVCHDVRHAVVNYADHEEADMLLMEDSYASSGLRGRLFGSDVEWVIRHAPCDIALLNVGPDGLRDLDVVGVLSDEGPYDPEKISVADALAASAGGSIALAYAGRSGASEIEERTLQDYHDAVASLCSVPVESCVPVGATHRDDDSRGSLSDADLIVVSAAERTNDAIASYLTGTDRPVLVIHQQETELQSRLTRAVERRLF